MGATGATKTQTTDRKVLTEIASSQDYNFYLAVSDSDKSLMQNPLAQFVSIPGSGTATEDVSNNSPINNHQAAGATENHGKPQFLVFH